jgi:hypothetical protein
MEPIEPGEKQEEVSRFPLAFALGAVVVALLFGGLFLLTKVTKPSGPAAVRHLPFGAGEQAYAQHIHFNDIQMAKATNFINQEFTYVAGTISNDGSKTLRGLEVNIEFHDPFNQVILRDSEQLVTPSQTPMDGGQRRDFQVTLEHVPAEWNQQYPVFRITGLLLE